MQESALREALAQYRPSLLRFALSLTRDPEQAEDLVQETLLRAWERGADLREDAALAGWLRRILHNAAVDASRRQREVPAEDIVEQVEAQWRDDAYTVDVAEVVARLEARADLEDALVHLPMIYRSAVILHDAEGMTVAQIADLQQVGVSAIKQRLRRGRMLLVTQLAQGHSRRVQLAGVPLRCWEARRRVSEYLDGQVDATTAGLLERHLGACPTCPPLYQSLVAARAALGAAAAVSRDPDTVVPPAVADRIARLRGA